MTDANRTPTATERLTQERRFHVLTENALDVVAVLDADATVRYESPSLERILGWRPDEIEGRPALELIHPDDRPLIQKLLADNIATPNAIVSVEYRCRHKNGNWRVLESIASNLLHDPAVNGIVINSRDVTERKQTEYENQLRARQQKAIAELGQRALSGMAVLDLMSEAVEVVARTFDVEYCIILELDPVTNTTLLVAGSGCDPALIGNVSVPVVPDTLTGRTLLFNEPVIFENLLTDRRFPASSMLYDYGIVSGISVVIHGEKGAWGVLTACSQKPRSFQTDDVAVVQSLANVLAEAIRRKGVEDRLRGLREEQTSILNSIGDGVHGINLDGVITFGNPASSQLLGYSLQDMAGKSAHELIHYATKDGTPYTKGDCPIYNTLYDGKVRRVREEYFWRKDKTAFPVDLTVTPTRNSDGEIVGATVVFTDITERLASESALRESEERFSNAFEHAAIGMALVGLDGKWQKANQAVFDLVGYSEAELYELTFQDITHSEDLEADLHNVHRLLNDEIKYYHMEKRYIHKNGHIIWILLAVSLVRDRSGEPLHFISQIQDITERKRAEERLIYDALHDSLTGLANRALLIDHIEVAFRRFKQSEEQGFALILLDLDRFKNINDTLGHPVGDLVLLEMARRFMDAAREPDTVARLGGDEFAILLEDLSGDNSPTQVARRLLAATDQPLIINNSQVDITTSIGIVVVTQQHRSTAEIFRDADIALYRAKAAGRGNYQVFDQNMHRHIRERMELEAELRRAVERGQMSLYLQPVISLETGKIMFFEALLRWQHPKRGFVSPDIFIPIAEETGIIISISHWVAREVCRIIRNWPAANPPAISMNASPAEIIRPRPMSQNFGTGTQAVEDFDTSISRILNEEGVSPDKVKIEITEGVLISDAAYAGRVLGNLVANGFNLLLDDFGTGYSSFSYLQDLPISQVKLDRVFTAKLLRGNRSYELMRGIVTLAHNIGLQVVAEGVENEEQLSLIREAGCDYIQGYLVSKPLPVEEAYKLYASDYRW